MGNATLGALFGTNMSFDAASWTSLPNSWRGTTLTGSYTPSPINSIAALTDVHSSDRGCLMRIYSGTAVNSSLNYPFKSYDVSSGQNGLASQFSATKIPAVGSHSVALSFWARAVTAPGVVAGILTDSLDQQIMATPAVASAGVLQRYDARGGVLDSVGRFFMAPTSVLSGSVFVGSARLYLDDVLVRVDELTLQPEWSFEEQARLIRQDLRTRMGNLHTFVSGKYFAYKVPLRYLSAADADVLNWWWQNQWPLAFTLDTSDAESTYIVRITNNTQPIGKRIAPYANQFEGSLELESVVSGLVF